MVSTKKFSLAACILIALVSAAPAQSIQWQPDSNGYEVNRFADLKLVFNDCKPADDVLLPNIPWLEIGSPSLNQQTTMQMHNWSMVTKLILVYQYPVRPTKDGKFTIPEFTIKTDKGPVTVPKIDIDVRKSALPPQSSPGAPSTPGTRAPSRPGTSGTTFAPDAQIDPDGFVSSSVKILPESPWLGQIFTVSYELLNIKGEHVKIASYPSVWDPDLLIMEEWSEPEKIQREYGGGMRSGLGFLARGYVISDNDLNLSPVTQDLEVQFGQRRGFGFFSQPVYKKITATSNSLKLKVKPLPPDAPEGFTGAVGDNFKIKSALVPNKVNAGDPITWTLEIEGEGNWRSNFPMPSRAAPQGLKVITSDPKIDGDPKNPFYSKSAQDFVLVPQKPGVYEIPGISFVYFDPIQAKYKTITSAPHVIDVSPGSAATPVFSANTSQGGGSQDFSSPVAETPKTSTALASTAPPELIRPLLPLAGIGIPAFRPIPLEPWSMAAVTLIMIAFMAAALWIVLAWVRHIASHPYRQRALALKSLKTLLAGINTELQGQEAIAKILEWQSLLARALGLPDASPAKDKLLKAARPSFRKDEQLKVLEAAWDESVEIVCTRDKHGKISSGWLSGALEIASALKVPQPPFMLFFRARNFFPAICLFLVLSGTQDLLAEERQVATTLKSAEEIYQSGRFKEAGRLFLDKLEISPNNPAARSNYASCLAQQDLWDEAFAHWLSASLSRPWDSTIAWNLDIASRKASYASPVVQSYIAGDGMWLLAKWLPAWLWQAGFMLGFFLGLLALTLRFLCEYNHLPRKFSKTSGRLFLASLVFAMISLTALASYGHLGNARAALIFKDSDLRTVPTDLDEGQQKRPVTAGTLVLVEKDFLGWRLVNLPNGEKGWLRSSFICPLYTF